MDTNYCGCIKDVITGPKHLTYIQFLLFISFLRGGSKMTYSMYHYIFNVFEGLTLDLTHLISV